MAKKQAPPLDLEEKPKKPAKKSSKPTPTALEKHAQDTELGTPEDRTPAIARWVILGLDPSLSNTGFSVMLVDQDKQWWYDVGSVSPGTRDEEPWIRSKSMGIHLCSLLSCDEIREFCQEAPTGLLLSYEAPTVGNDYLQIANLGARMTLRGDSLAMDQFYQHWELQTNAATMRAIMGLKEKGSTNKNENRAKAWTYLGEGEFPNLDTDACDAVLFTMLGLWTTRVFRDGPDKAKTPELFKVRFCSTNMEHQLIYKTAAGKVVSKTALKAMDKDQKKELVKEKIPTHFYGVLFNPVYWKPYTLSQREVQVRNARSKKSARLASLEYPI